MRYEVVVAAAIVASLSGKMVVAEDEAWLYRNEPVLLLASEENILGLDLENPDGSVLRNLADGIVTLAPPPCKAGANSHSPTTYEVVAETAKRYGCGSVATGLGYKIFKWSNKANAGDLKADQLAELLREHSIERTASKNWAKKGIAVLKQRYVAVGGLGIALWGIYHMAKDPVEIRSDLFAKQLAEPSPAAAE